MELKSILEAVLFSSQKPLSARELRDLLTTTAENSDEAITKSFKKVKESELDSALEALAKDSESLARSYRLVCVAGAWQFVTQPDYGPWLKTLVG
ncbi:MAG TPA: SMC-Scp complex subunit ScpB, partial [Verrucomicrobiae bacterium]